MKLNYWKLLSTLGLILGAVSIFLLVQTNFSRGAMAFFIIYLIFFGLFYLLWRTSSIHIKKDSITIKKNEDNNITISYNEYTFQINLDNYKYNIKVPQNDMNGKKVSWVERISLSNYLTENRDKLSLPNNIILISDNDVIDYFTDMKLGDDELKNKYLNLRTNTFMVAIIVLPILMVVLIGNSLVDLIKYGTMSSDDISNFMIFIVLTIICLIMGIIKKLQVKNGEVYSCKVKIYDRHIETDSEGYLVYYIRVWNGDKYVLSTYFIVDKDFYEKGIDGTLYLVRGNRYCYTDFEKGRY